MPLYNPKTYDKADEFGPYDLGLKSWNYDPSLAVSGGIGSGGALMLMQLIARNPIIVTNVHLSVFTAGASLNNVGVAVYDAAGTLLGSRINAGGATAALFQTAVFQTCTLLTPVNMPAGPFYVGYWTTGTTQPAVLRTGNAAYMNTGTTLASGTGLRYAIANTGLVTSAPSTFTQTAVAPFAYWAAVS